MDQKTVHRISWMQLDDNLHPDLLPTVKNLGVILDSKLSFENHISHVTETIFLHLRNIAKLRNMLPVSFAEEIAHAFMASSSRLDYCTARWLSCILNKQATDSTKCSG